MNPVERLILNFQVISGEKNPENLIRRAIIEWQAALDFHKNKKHVSRWIIVRAIGCHYAALSLLTGGGK